MSGGEGLRGDAALGDHPNNHPITGADALHAITAPVCTASGTRVPGLRLGEQRSHALLAALPVFRLQPGGFTNKDLRTLARMTTMAPGTGRCIPKIFLSGGETNRGVCGAFTIRRFRRTPVQMWSEWGS